MEEEFLWIQRIRQGETDYFHRLYQKHHQRLFSLCWRFVRSAQDAEEQLQEIFLKILQKLDRFEARSSFSTWAYRLATNHMINFINRGRRDETSLEDAPETSACETDHELAMALRKAVAQLPDGFRKVFILHDQEGFRHEEIADILGCSAATSRSQLCRARLALRDKLKPLMQERSYETR